MSNPNTTAQYFMDNIANIANMANLASMDNPFHVNMPEMPEIVNKWTRYYQNPKDYASLKSAAYASFLSPFETVIEFVVQALATAAINTFFSLATLTLAAAALYFFVQAGRALLFSEDEDKYNQAINHMKCCVIMAAASFAVNLASSFVMQALMASLVLRSVVTLYKNRTAVMSFFNQKVAPFNTDTNANSENSENNEENQESEAPEKTTFI